MTGKPLSPAAAAVRDASIRAYWLYHPRQIAAALRAAADTVVPETDATRSPCREHCVIGGAAERIRDELLAIADELEAGR